MKNNQRVEDRPIDIVSTVLEKPTRYTYEELQELGPEKISKWRDVQNRRSIHCRVLACAGPVMTALTVLALNKFDITEPLTHFEKHPLAPVCLGVSELALFFCLFWWKGGRGSKKAAKQLDEAVVVMTKDSKQARFKDTMSELVEQGYFMPPVYPRGPLLGEQKLLGWKI